jgi:hypothetical protein
MQPHGTVAILLNQQLIKLLIAFCSVGYQDGSILYRLPKSRRTDIRGAASQVVRVRRSPNLSI